MKTKVKKLRFIAKIARNIACIAAFCALSASAEDTRALGYATAGTAAELPAAPDMGGTVVNVTAAQAQYVLDGAYGSIDGKTINFTESVADTLVIGRASKYEGSGTLYRHGSHDGEAMSYADFIAYKNQATWTESCYYERKVENVTFTADADVIVNFTAEGGAHVYGTESAPVYDYVRDTGTWTFDTNNSFYKRAILKNITFKGLTFTAKTNFETSESTTVFDGFTFTGCAFEIGSTADGNYALRYYDEYNNGNVRNLVVENCTFKNCYQGIYAHHVKGITVKGCTFDTTGHNAIAVQCQGGEKGACDHGAVVITGNTFKNIGDRIIRFNEVGSGTTITIADNTADGNSGKLNKTTGEREIVAAVSLPENVAEIISASNNDWGANAVAEGVFADAKPVVTGVTVSGIAGFENKSFESFAAAYAAIKPTVEKLGLGQEGATTEQFDALFTSVDANGDATVTYTISGNVIYDEAGCENLLSMGRKASHYGNGRHLINFKFVGKTGRDADTLTINSSLTLPYEWWGEKKVTGIHFKNLTLTGSAPSGLYASQSYFEGIDFSVANCTLKGLKIYNCSNVPGSYSITDSVLDGTGASADSYAIHLQGNETAPLAITISGNTITGYDRGINIDQKTAVATISGNTISVNDAGRSCVQLTQLAETTISGNKLNLTGGNAITLHENLLGLAAAPKISVMGNNIEGNGYLVYDDAAANGKAFTSDSLALTYGTDNTVAETVDTTKGVKGSTVVSTSADVNNVIQHYVAKIGEAGYSTLAEAIAAAKDGETVTLIADVTEDVIVATSVTLDLGGKTLTNAGAGKVTLTIAEGKTVTVKNGSIVGGASNYTIQNNGTATFEDVTATAGNVGSSMLDNVGTLTINSGTYVGGMNTVKNEPKATLTINGGTFENSHGEFNSHTAVIYNAGSAEILGGELRNKATSPAWAYPHVVMTVWDKVNKPSTVVKGGKFTCDWTSWQASILNDAGGGTAGCTTVSGGTFNKKVPENYCAAGFIPTANGDGTYGVKEGAYVAAIGDVKYETVDAAMEAAAANETATTVKLLAESVDETIVPTWYIKGDVTIDADSAVKATFAPIENAADAPDTDGMAYLASDDAEKARTITVGEKVTLSFPNTAKKKGAFYVGYGKDGNWAPTHLVLNGRIEAYLPYIGAGSSLTISKTGSLKSLSENLITRYGSTMTVTGTDGAWSAENPQVDLGYSSQQGGEVTFKDTFASGGAYWTMWNRNGNADVATRLMLDNTTFTAEAFNGSEKSAGETSAYQVELKNGSKMTIAGDFAVIAEGAVTIEAGSLLTAKSISNAGTLTVRADALTDAVKVIDYTGMGAMTLADYGTVKAEGGELYVEDNDLWIRRSTAVAAIGEVRYETLADALAAAKDGETVKMLADAELAAAQTISQKLVLDLNGKAIRSAVDKFLVITKGGDLTVSDATNEGRIENTATELWARVLEMKGGVLTVKGGTIAANTATLSSSQTITVTVGAPSTINLAGGRIEAIRTANHAQGVIELGTYANATLNVTGGEIVGSGTGIRSLAGNAVNVSGGTIVGQTGNAVYSSKASALTITGGSLESKGASIAFGMGTGNSAVTIGREGGSASDVIIPSMDFDGRFVTVNLLSGTIKEFRKWTEIKVEKVSQGAATLLVGTDISTKLPGSNLLCQKDEASGLYEVVELTVENAAATVLHDGVETSYNTVEQARQGVVDGDTLTLKVDHTGSLAFTAQNVTIDLGGKTLTGTGSSTTPALSFNQSATANNSVTVKNGTIVAEGEGAACIRATSGAVAKTLTVVLGDGLTLTASSNNRSGRVVLDKGARTAAPCADVNNGGLLVTEDGKDWIYGETETAFTHANGTEVTLQHNWYIFDDFNGTIKVPDTAAFASAKLNLGNHKISAFGGAAIVMGNDAKPAEGTAVKSLEILNGEILTSSHGAAVCGSNKTLVFDNVKLTTEKLQSTDDDKLGLYVNGTTRGNAVTLKNGSALTASGTGIYFPGAGTLTVVDSAVTGAKSGIEIRAGILNVSGTSAIASTATAFSFKNNDSGVTTTGAAIAAVKHSVGNDLTVNIAGGTFTGPCGFYANDPNPTKGGKVTVAISGGTFSTEVLREHCAEGYEPVTNADGTYGVKATFEIVTVKTAIGSDTTINVRIPNALMETVAGETLAEKVENLSKADANGNLAWVNLVAGIDSTKKVTMAAPQNDNADVIDVNLPAVGTAPAGTDVTVRYEIHAEGSEAAVVSATAAEDLVINLNGKAGIGTYRAYVCLLQNGTEVARVASENKLGVLQTVSAAKKTIIAVPWLSLTADGNAIAVADLVKTAGLSAGDKLHVYNKAESRYDVYELAADRAWTPKAVYKVGADGTVETASSGTPETTTVARGNGVWLERQDTTKAIVSYGQVASGTVATTIDAGTAEKPTWNLLAVPTTTAVNIETTFGASEADTLIVPTTGAPKICTVKDGAWAYEKSVPVTDESGNKLGVKVVREKMTELPAGTGFWYLNGGAAKTVNW